jgi:hypothetical protein
MYLMIRNPGVADPCAFTLLGVSTTRSAGVSGTIGMYGSGSKNALAKFLRDSIPVTIIPGNLKMEFFSKPKFVQGQQFNQVCVKYSGKNLDGSSQSSTQDLGFTLEWGVADWTKLAMAFREFVANAIDGSIISGGTYKDVEIEVVDKPRAKAGHTAVFLPLTPEVQECWKGSGTLFLHLSHPHLLGTKLLPKLTDSKNTLIYKNGVLVCKVEEEGVFDYNLGEELTLDESRNAHIWDVRYSCAHAIANAETGDLAKILMAQIEGRKVFESKLETNYIYNEMESAEKKKVKADRFQQAFKTVAGDSAVICTGSQQVVDFVKRKGFQPVKIEGNWFQTLERFGVATENGVLSGLEKDGKETSNPTEEMVDCTQRVWSLLESFKLTNGKPIPKVKGFMSIMNGESQTFGYYEMGKDTIYLHSSLGVGKMMFKVTLEEAIHYITQSNDLSRDLQDFLFNLVTEIAF